MKSSTASRSPSPEKHASPRSALVWVALGASLWGTDTVFRRLLTAALSSLQIVLLEHLILTIILLPVFWRARRGLSARQWGAVFGVAWGGSALGSVFFTDAVRFGNPTTAVLLQKTQPIFAILLARVVLGERLRPRLWMWLAVAMAATYLVSFGAASPTALLQHTPAATGYALAAAALWGGSTVLGRFALRDIPFPHLTALRIVTATPLLTLLVCVRPYPWPALTPAQALLLLGLALIPGLAALLLYYRGLGQTQANRAAIAELSFPATAALLNWTIVGTGITMVQAGGFALLWIAILAM
jgi:drug/metabolite transporter (DMT)-like permease